MLNQNSFRYSAAIEALIEKHANEGNDSMWSIWRERQVNRNAYGGNYSFVLGRTADKDKPFYLNFESAFEGFAAHAPYTLVTGMTGSGKSSFLRNLILDIAITNTPDLAAIKVFDPNGGWAFESLKGLHRMRVETNIETAKSYLEGITKSIQAHEQLFETLGVKTLEECNKVLGLKKRLLRTFVIIDEVAVWMIDDDFKAKLLNALEAISTKGWSTGYHLILVTQWPDPRVLPKEVRDHFGNRISLKLPTAEMSEYALGIKGAEELTDLGHMLAVLAGEPKPINCWVPWLSDEDAERMAAQLDAPLFRVSVREGLNIKALFTYLAVTLQKKFLSSLNSLPLGADAFFVGNSEDRIEERSVSETARSATAQAQQGGRCEVA